MKKENKKATKKEKTLSKENSLSTLSIEDSFKMLDKIVNDMDDDKCSIEKSIELYESGIKIINDLTKKIDKIESDLKVLNNNDW